MMKVYKIIYISVIVSIFLSSYGCSPCYRATRLRHKASKMSGAERHKLEGQATSLESACLKKRDDKYEGKMNKEFEEMEKKAKD